MQTSELFLKRNAIFAAEAQSQKPTLVPTTQAVVIGCCDHRVDPAHVLGLGLNDAVVIRNAGGRINEDVIRTIVILGLISRIEAFDIAPTFVVMHHTDCGLSRLSGPEYAELLAPHLGTPASQIDEADLSDPFRSVQADIAKLRSHPLFPTGIPIVGFVYDVESRVAESV